MQEEACILRVPCVTLRGKAENPETGGGCEFDRQVWEKILYCVIKISDSDFEWENLYENGNAAKLTLRNIVTGETAKSLIKIFKEEKCLI